MKTHEYTFPKADGHALAAKLDLPVLRNPRAHALF